MKILTKHIAVFILILFTCALFSGCKPTYHTIVFEKNYFSSPITLVLRQEKNAKISINTAKTKIEDIISDLESKLSITKNNSDVYKFNNLKAGEFITVSNETKVLLEKSISYYTQTNGAFNPLIYPLVDLWQLSSEKYGKTNTFTVPTENEIINTAKYTANSNLTLSDLTLTKNNFDQTKIDLGGIGKGYAVQLVIDFLKENGYTHGYFNIGTSSIGLLDYEDGWILSVKHPRKENQTIMSFKATNISLSTSGDYERFYLQNGKRYCHIISPFTNAPIETGIVSVTVLGNDACYCDALTTALSVMNINDAIEFTKQNLTDFMVYILHESNENLTLYTNQQERSITLLDNQVNIFEII